MDEAWNQTGLRYLSEASYEKRVARYAPRPGDLVLSREGSIGRSVILKQENVCLGQRVMVLGFFEDGLLNRYCQLVLTSPYAWNLYMAANVGTGVKHINVSMIKDIPIPLPPRSEQIRIIEIIEGLQPHINDYGALEDARERLEAELPDRLRKSILQLAVQGKLVEQDSADEPASTLLDRIRAERAALVKAKKLKAPEGGESVIYRASDGGYYEKRGKGEPVCIDDEIPFEIPKSWAWARMSTVATLHSGTSYKKDEIRTSGIRIIRGGNIIVPNVVLADDDVFLDKAFADNEKTIHEGDIVIVASTGSSAALGRAAYINEAMPGVQIGAFLRILRSQTEMRRWNWLVMSTEYYRSRIRLLAKGTNINNIKEAHIMDMLIPVPPIKEQSRIVSQVEILLASVG